LPRKSQKLNEIRAKFQSEIKQPHTTIHTSVISQNKKLDQVMKLENQPKIKFVSTIDSRPIDPPLLTLLTLDEFVKET
jgi:hypothetical protein